MENPQNASEKICHSTPKTADLRRKALKRNTIKMLKSSDSFTLLQTPLSQADGYDVDANANISLLKQKLHQGVRTINYKSLQSEYSGIFPRGRRPFLQLPGLQYEIDEQDTEDEVGEEITSECTEDVEEGRRVRLEHYEFDSFVLENGYLSDEECFETPKAGRKEKRVQMIKIKSASEKKRAKKGKVNEMKSPEVVGLLYSKRTGTVSRQFTKWRPIVFQSSPIPTGLSVGWDLMRQSQHELNHSQDSGFAEDQLHLLEDVLQDQPRLLNQILHHPAHQASRIKEEARRVEKCEPELPGLHPAPLLLPPDQKTEVSTCALLPEKSNITEMKSGVCPDYGTKYKVKYAVKQCLYSRFDKESSGSLSGLEALERIRSDLTTQLDKELMSVHKELVHRYTSKYLAKLKYK